MDKEAIAIIIGKKGDALERLRQDTRVHIWIVNDPEDKVTSTLKLIGPQDRIAPAIQTIKAHVKKARWVEKSVLLSEEAMLALSISKEPPALRINETSDALENLRELAGKMGSLKVWREKDGVVSLWISSQEELVEKVEAAIADAADEYTRNNVAEALPVDAELSYLLEDAKVLEELRALAPNTEVQESCFLLRGTPSQIAAAVEAWVKLEENFKRRSHRDALVLGTEALVALGFGGKKLAPWHSKEVLRQLAPPVESENSSEGKTEVVIAKDSGEAKVVWIGTEAYLKEGRKILDDKIAIFQKQNIRIEVKDNARGAKCLTERVSELQQIPGMNSVYIENGVVVASGEEAAMAQCKELVESILTEVAAFTEEEIPVGPSDDVQVLQRLVARFERAFEGCELIVPRADRCEGAAAQQTVKALMKAQDLPKFKKALKEALDGSSKWGTQVMKISKEWPEYERQVFGVLIGKGGSNVRRVQEQHGVLMQLVSNRGVRLVALEDEGGEKAWIKVLKAAELEVLSSLDNLVISTNLEPLPAEAVPIDQGNLKVLADYTYATAHANAAALGRARTRGADPPEVTIRGHPSATQQFNWAWEKSFQSKGHVDCLPLQTYHAPKGKDGKAFASKLQQVQKKHTEVTVEIREAARLIPPREDEEAGEDKEKSVRKLPLGTRLWLFAPSGEEAAVNSCRAEILSGLAFLFPDEYTQIHVRNSLKWAEKRSERLRQLQASTGVSVVLDRRRSMLLICGTADEVKAAKQRVAELDSNDPLAEAHKAEDDPSSGPVSAGGRWDAGPPVAGHDESDEGRNRASSDNWRSPSEAAASPAASPLIENVNPATVGKKNAGYPPVSTQNTSNGVRKVRNFEPQFLQPAAHCWFYIDDTGAAQGPFKPEEMNEWWIHGYLPDDLLVIHVPENERPPEDQDRFMTLADVFITLGGFDVHGLC